MLVHVPNSADTADARFVFDLLPWSWGVRLDALHGLSNVRCRPFRATAPVIMRGPRSYAILPPIDKGMSFDGIFSFCLWGTGSRDTYGFQKVRFYQVYRDFVG